MKQILLAAGILSSVICTSAFAQTTTNALSQAQSWKPPVSTLTRAQVERSLVHAEKDGQLKYLDTVVYKGAQ